MILIEEDMTISMANGEFVRNTGYSLDEINGRMKWTELVHPDEVEQMIEQHRLRREGGALPGYEFRYITKTGDLRDALLSIQLVPGTEQSVASLIDITERKRAEDALVKSEEKFRLITENMVDCVALVDINGIYKYVTPSYRNILGYDPEDMIGIKGLSLVHPDDLERITRIYLEGIEQCWREKYFETRTRHKDGHYVDMELRARLLNDSQGKVIGAIWAARDITKRLQLEQERKQAEEKLQQTLESLRKAVGTTIQVMVSAVESRDPYTAGHQSRSADLACAIATEMGLAQDKIEGIRMAGSIHDIGKLSIPAEILSKPTKLTDIEFSLIKEHSRSGYEMLKDVESPWPLAEIVYQHHERMNGSGYPRNLKGDEILMEARIMAVADVVEAMASHRPYRPALGIEAALEEIEKNKGILYDNAVADACLRLFREKGYQLT